MTHAPLRIFLSYASEDQAIADALNECLSSSFHDKVDVQTMTRFQIGSDWRRTIDDGVDGADVLIAISTGRSKAGHSYTGYEIGAFAFSCRHKGCMGDHPNVPRKMIPFTMLSGVPDPLYHIQAVNLDPKFAFNAQYDANRIDSELSHLRSDGEAVYSEKIFGLLKDIYDLTRQAEGHATAHVMDQKLQTLRSKAQSLSKAISELLLTRERYSARPKSKLLVRIEPQCKTGGVTQAQIRIEGPCSNAFGISTSPTRPMSWKDFTARVNADDITTAWKSTFDDLMLAAAESHFPDRKLTSYDRKKTFRVFISKVIEYYSGALEYHIYVVELMREREYGDATANLFQNALRVALAYRSMFLEETSEFGPDLMMMTEPSEFPKAVAKLKGELEYILQFARETDLYESRSNHTILGKSARDDMDERYRLWEDERQALMEMAHRVLAQQEEPTSLKRKFVAQLRRFCENTRPLNEDYLVAVLERLQLKIGLILRTDGIESALPLPNRAPVTDGRARQPENTTVPPRRRIARSSDAVLTPVRSQHSARGITENSGANGEAVKARQTT
jgi:hypothetical protein